MHISSLYEKTDPALPVGERVFDSPYKTPRWAVKLLVAEPRGLCQLQGGATVIFVGRSAFVNELPL